jgi:Rrf2 family protein
VTAGPDDLRAVLRVSARADYAVLLVVALSLHPDEVVSREHLAHTEGLPVKFVDHVLRQLRGGGVIESRRGRHGGYLLARPAEDVSLAEVVHVMAEPQPASGSRPELPAAERVDWLAAMWSGVSTVVDAALADVTIAVLRDARQAESTDRGAQGA